jgi:hypothetical protein
VDIVAASDLRACFLALVAPFDRFAPPLKGELRFPPEFHATPLRAFSTFACAGTY